MSGVDSLELVGKTIAEKYVVDSLVDEGGFAIVYRATHLLWKRPVALKVFKLLAGFSAKDRERLVDEFVREGSVLADLSERSAAICQARDVGMLSAPNGDQIPYMVLEWLEGDNLERVFDSEQRQSTRPRSLLEAVALLEPVAEALSMAHRKGIAHRDVKPSNVFVIGDPRSTHAAVKLLDFGIAKVVADAQQQNGAFSKTSGHVTSFTPAYGAPEQFSRTHGATGPWTDVFALALILVEAITGKSPLEGDDYVQLAVSSGDPNRRPTPRGRGAEVSDEVEEVFARALAIKPQNRYSDCGQFWNALRHALHMQPMRAMTGPPADITVPRAAPTPERPSNTSTLSNTSATHRSSRARPMRTWSIAGGAALLIFGGVAFFSFGNKQTKYNAANVPAAANPSAGSATASPSPPPPNPAAAEAKKTCPEGMVSIPGGRFFMGSDEGLSNEKPAHQVAVAAYCIDKYEVTMHDYKECSDVGACKRASDKNDWPGISEGDRKAYDPLCNARDPDGRGKHPVNCVDWSMAQRYCAEQKKRLPTEAEWEFAARGPDGRQYPWGDEDPTADRLNACGSECVVWGKKARVQVEPMYDANDGWAATAPVGSFPKGQSRYGVEDVVGNVWEWTSDWYGSYSTDEQTNPTGPASGEARVIRGGAWNGSHATWVRPSFRYRDVPTSRSHGIGFRCAMSL